MVKKTVLLTTAVVLVAALAVAYVLNMNMRKSSPAVQQQTESAPSPSAGSGKVAVKEFQVEAKPFSFTPNVITVKQGDTVTIVLNNTKGMHDFRIDEFSVATKKISEGESDTVQFVADKKGSFEYYCSVGNHRAMGMKGTLVVE